MKNLLRMLVLVGVLATPQFLSAECTHAPGDCAARFPPEDFKLFSANSADRGNVSDVIMPCFDSSRLPAAILFRLRPTAVTAGSACALALLAAPLAPADPLITEFMASNSTALADDDRDFPDWIELYNPDATAVNLNGWYLTDNATNKKKWTFPAVTIAPQGFLVVFASGKDRRDPAKTLHTSFSLNADGEYLALVHPDGTTFATEFAPGPSGCRGRSTGDRSRAAPPAPWWG